MKFIASKGTRQTRSWGANFEIGALDKKLDVNPGNAECEGIIGRRAGRWTAAFNANADLKVSGPRSASASLGLDITVSYAFTKSLD